MSIRIIRNGRTIAVPCMATGCFGMLWWDGAFNGFRCDKCGVRAFLDVP